MKFALVSMDDWVLSAASMHMSKLLIYTLTIMKSFGNNGLMFPVDVARNCKGNMSTSAKVAVLAGATTTIVLHEAVKEDVVQTDMGKYKRKRRRFIFG